MSGVSNLQQHPAGSSHDLTVTLAYSPASQLISRGADNDAYAWTGATLGTTSYGAATGLNQYPSIDSDPYSYDANGNLTIGGGRTRAYDVENRLIAITGAQNLSLAYDPLGRLRETSTGVGSTEFLYSGDALVAEYNAMGALTQRYVHGAGIDEPLVSYAGTGTTSRSWLLADERGSIIADTTAAGAAAAIGRVSSGLARVALGGGSGGGISAGHTTALSIMQEGQMPAGQDLIKSTLFGTGVGLLGGVGAEALRMAGPATLQVSSRASLAEKNLVGNINHWTRGSYPASELEAARLLRMVGQVGDLMFNAAVNTDFSRTIDDHAYDDEPVCAGRAFFSFGCP